MRSWGLIVGAALLVSPHLSRAHAGDVDPQLLKALAREGTAILMVEHDMDLVMGVCDLIHVLEFGQVIATGTPAEIRADKKVQAAYLGFSDDSEQSHDAEQALNAVAHADTHLFDLTGDLS